MTILVIEHEDEAPIGILGAGRELILERCDLILERRNRL